MSDRVQLLTDLLAEWEACAEVGWARPLSRLETRVVLAELRDARENEQAARALLAEPTLNAKIMGQHATLTRDLAAALAREQAAADALREARELARDLLADECVVSGCCGFNYSIETHARLSALSDAEVPRG